MEENTNNVPATLSNSEEPKFRGYTLDDLRYRRALVSIQKEYAKAKTFTSLHKVAKYSPFSRDYDSKGARFGRIGALTGKLLNGLNYIDYVMLGYTVFNSGRKIFSFFRKKK